MAKHAAFLIWRMFVLLSLFFAHNATNYNNVEAETASSYVTTTDGDDSRLVSKPREGGIVDTTPKDTDDKTLTASSEDSRKTYTQGSVEVTPIVTSSDGVDNRLRINSEDLNNILTTELNDVDNTITATQSSPEGALTTVENKSTGSPNILNEGKKLENEHIPRLVSTVEIGVIPLTLTPGKGPVNIGCTAVVDGFDIIGMNSISIYRTRSNSIRLMTKVVSVVKMNNTSMIRWSDESLLARRGVNVTAKFSSTYCFLNLDIHAPDTVCGDAQEYRCIMSAVTNTGLVTDISVSQRIHLYPPVDPYYTDDIEVKYPEHVNSEHEYPIGTEIELACTGSVGSDRLKHKWQVSFEDDPCSRPYGVFVVSYSSAVEPDGCNIRGRSRAIFTIPNVTRPIVAWCWVSYAHYEEEECAELTENRLMRRITITPVASDKSTDPCLDSRLRSYIVKPESTTYRQDEPLNLTCSYTGSEELWWFFRRSSSESWIPVIYHFKESQGWNSTTLTIPKLSLIHRGWYAFTTKECSEHALRMNGNQTLFVDVSYEPCRQNGILIPGDACVEIMRPPACAAQNGTVASIHTESKSKMLYGFAFHVLLIERYVNIGLSLTANTLSWKNFVWADGSPLTYSEKINNADCLVCLEDYPAAIAMEYKKVVDLSWVLSLDDTHVACEWPVDRRLTGVSMPPGTSDYSGSKAMFQCTSGEYISAVYVCDRTSDCSDVSDELNCVTGCVGATFQCDYGECIPVSKSCDFIKDCADGSDVLLCNFRPCNDGFWQCANKECIPVYDVCDGEVECADGSDEADVLCIDNNILPSDYTFRCFQPNRILPLARKCDGVQDCSDKFESDEKMCPSLTTYYSCSSWADITTDSISSHVAVEYGMPQYGKPEVYCLIADRKVHTAWGFSSEQYIAIPYIAVAVLSDALWFETKWASWQFQPIVYMSPFQQKAMIASSSSCVQYIRPCVYFVYFPDVFIEWTSGDGDIHSMEVADYVGCNGLCMQKDKCSVFFDTKDSQTSDYFDGNEEYGWIPITDKLQLPITSVRSNFVTIMGVSRLTCSEDLHNDNKQSVSSFLECKNGLNYDPSLQCLMNFDPTGEPMACRDLTHLENCENVTCPEYYAKCPHSFCLHMRYICDGTSHCPHQEDELDCESPNCTNHYRCRGGQPCVPFTYLCDGVRQCPLGDDELHCDETCPTGCTCNTLAFVCDSENEDLHLSNITSMARWISMKTDLRNVTNHFPVSFALLTTLVLRSCSLQKLIVDGQSIFKNITALRHLDISSNQIESLPEGIFSDITDLRTLILSNNPFAKISNGVFIGLTNLRTLDISYSNIRELTAESKVFSGLPSLEYLDLSSNFIHRLPGRIFSKLNSLQTLLLSDNPLMYIDVQAFSRLYSLSNLQLSQINSERILSGVFSGLHALTVLNLSSSGIHNLGLRSFQDLEILEKLDIQNNHFEVHEFMFDGLDHLQYLYADTYKMCCIKPKSVLYENCFAPKDLISSCSNLIGSDFLRIFLWVIGLSALVGNIFVLLYRLVLDNVNLKKSHSIFVINLSIADFIMGIYMIVIASVDTHLSGRYVVHDLTWRQGPLCVAAGCLSVISSEMSTFAILMITVDRFIAIVFPLSLRKMTWRTAVLVSLLLWVVSLILAIIPHALFPSYFKGEFYSRSGVCLALPLTEGRVPGQEYSVAIFIGLNGILFLVILIAQICIHRNCQGSGTISTNQNRKREIAVARSLFLVVATDFLCWFPVAGIGVWSQMGGAVSADVYAWVLVFVLPINSALNPFLYTYIYIKRRREINVALKQAKHVLETSKRKLLMTDGFNASNNLKEIHFSNLFRPHKDFVSLDKYGLDSKVSPMQAFQIARRIMKAISFLHQRNVIHGNVSDKHIYVSNKVQTMKRASLLLDQSPIGGAHDSHTDILQYGLLVKKLLRMLDRH